MDDVHSRNVPSDLKSRLFRKLRMIYHLAPEVDGTTGRMNVKNIVSCLHRRRIGLEGGGHRRDHLRAPAQRVEVAGGEVRIMGSKSRLLQTLAANESSNTVPIQEPKWRAAPDPDEHYVYAIAL